MKPYYRPLYVVGEKFVRIDENLKGKSMKSCFKLSLVKDINTATTYRDKKAAKSWDSYILAKYPDAKLKLAGLVLVK